MVRVNFAVIKAYAFMLRNLSKLIDIWNLTSQELPNLDFLLMICQLTKKLNKASTNKIYTLKRSSYALITRVAVLQYGTFLLLRRFRRIFDLLICLILQIYRLS